MATYKVTVVEVTEYPEKTTKYEAANGERYLSTYAIPTGMEHKEVVMETGRKLKREREVYTQDFTADDLTEIIKAVNDIK